MVAIKKKASKTFVKKQTSSSKEEIDTSKDLQDTSVLVRASSSDASKEQEKSEKAPPQKESEGEHAENGEGEKEQREEEKKFSLPWKKLFLLFWVVCILSLVFSGFLYFAYQQGVKAGENAVLQQLTLTPTPIEVTPTPKEADKSAYTITVLNGSGVGGAAATVETLLTDEGYTVDTIGNADNATYEKTVIQAKESVNVIWLGALRAFLETTYIVGDNEVLEEDAGADVVVIVGSKKQEN